MFLKKLYVFILLIIIICILGCSGGGGGSSATTTTAAGITTTTAAGATTTTAAGITTTTAAGATTTTAAGTTTTTGTNTTTTTSAVTTTTMAFPFSYASFETFVIDLDDYFSGDLSTYQNNIVDGQQTLITPYMTHLGTNHPEGSGKWYVYGIGTNWPVYTPGQALIYKADVERTSAESSVTVVGTWSVYSDFTLDLWFDSQKKIQFGHILALESLVNEALNTTESYIVVDAGEQVGVIYASGSALDVLMDDTAVDNGSSASGNGYGANRVCPLSYFTSSIQTTLNDYYDTEIYAYMQQGSTWPESRIDEAFNKNVDDTIWGTWWYKSGDLPYDEVNGGEDWYYFKYGFLVILKKSSLNLETFTRAPSYPYTTIEAECPDWAGLYIDYNGITQPAGNVARYVEAVSESEDFASSGILALKTFNAASTDIKYMQYSLDTTSDELSVKLYDSLAEAQADTSFTSPTVYVKDEVNGTPNDT